MSWIEREINKLNAKERFSPVVFSINEYGELLKVLMEVREALTTVQTYVYSDNADIVMSAINKIDSLGD